MIGNTTSRTICALALLATSSPAFASLIGDTVQWRLENCCGSTFYSDSAVVVAGASEFSYVGGAFSVSSNVEADTILVTVEGSGFNGLTIKLFWEDLDWPNDPAGTLTNATFEEVSSSGLQAGNTNSIEFDGDWVNLDINISVESSGFTVVYRVDLDTGQPIDDVDSDGVADDQDNCVVQANAEQRDTDSDGIGNFCDPDLNNDCRVDFQDLSGLIQVFFSADPNADLDGDGTVSFPDLDIFQQFFFGSPGPSGLPNGCQ